MPTATKTGRPCRNRAQKFDLARSSATAPRLSLSTRERNVRAQRAGSIKKAQKYHHASAPRFIYAGPHIRPLSTDNLLAREPRACLEGGVVSPQGCVDSGAPPTGPMNKRRTKSGEWLRERQISGDCRAVQNLPRVTTTRRCTLQPMSPGFQDRLIRSRVCVGGPRRGRPVRRWPARMQGREETRCAANNARLGSCVATKRERRRSHKAVYPPCVPSDFHF